MTKVTRTVILCIWNMDHFSRQPRCGRSIITSRIQALFFYWVLYWTFRLIAFLITGTYSSAHCKFDFATFIFSMSSLFASIPFSLMNFCRPSISSCVDTTSIIKPKIFSTDTPLCKKKKNENNLKKSDTITNVRWKPSGMNHFFWWY